MEITKRYKVISLLINTGEYDTSIEYLIEKSCITDSLYVCFANTHMAVEAHYDKEFRNQVNNATFVYPDGYPIAKSLKLLYKLNQGRIAGMDYIPKLLSKLDEMSLSVFFLGSTNEVVDNAIAIIRLEYPNVNVSGKIIPPFDKEWDNESYINEINRAKPNFVIVSLGCPKQERWMATYSSRINAVLLGVGAAVPVLAGVLSRSPVWMRKNGFEWVYRLIQEPRRLFMRYFTSNFVFVYLFIQQFIKIRLLGIKK